MSRFQDWIEGVVQRFILLKGRFAIAPAAGILRRDFIDIDSIGPVRVARFLNSAPDDDLRADVAGAVRRFLTLVEEAGG